MIIDITRLKITEEFADAFIYDYMKNSPNNKMLIHVRRKEDVGVIFEAFKRHAEIATLRFAKYHRYDPPENDKVSYIQANFPRISFKVEVVGDE